MVADDSGQNISLEEFRSHTLEYKSVLQQRGQNGAFEVAVYRWRTPEEMGEDEAVWERVAGPFVVDDAQRGKEIAREHLALLSGEVVDGEIPDDIVQWLREYSGDGEARFVSSSNYRARCEDDDGERDLEPLTKVALVHDLCVVESGNRWFLGMVEEENMVRCWESFGSLKEAVEKLGQ